MSESELSIATADGKQLFTREWKPVQAARAVIVLIHGLGEHSGRYPHVAAALNAAGYAVIAPDLRGHGHTAGIRGHIPSMAIAMEDIRRVIEEAGRRYPGLPQFLYGHSLGGSLVLKYILTIPSTLRGAIVTGPGLAVSTPVTGLKLAAARLLYRLAPSFTMPNGLDLTGLSSDPAVIQRVQSDPYYHTRASVQLGLDAIKQGEWLQTQTGQVPVPLLIMQGTADRVVNLAATRCFSKNITGDVTYREWEGWYHELHNEPGRAEFFKAINAWLDAKLA